MTIPDRLSICLDTKHATVVKIRITFVIIISLLPATRFHLDQKEIVDD